MIIMHVGSILSARSPDKYPTLFSLETRRTLMLSTIVLTYSKLANSLSLRATEGKNENTRL